MGVGFFTPAMFVLYLAFVPADRVRDLPRSLRTRFSSTKRVSPHPELTDIST
jgi:hypothetical protein